MNKIFFFLTLLLQGTRQGQKSGFEFRVGDLIFQDCDCGELCDAIEDVTISRENRRYSHIGIVVEVGAHSKVIEANIGGVKKVDLNSFIYRYQTIDRKPTVSVGRLQPKYQNLISSAILFCLGQIGKKYDDEYLFNNGKYYCSELIYEAFASANKKKAFFQCAPMTFKKPNDTTTHTAFQKYYKQLSIDVPEGKLGINPGLISQDPRLIFYDLY